MSFRKICCLALVTMVTVTMIQALPGSERTSEDSSATSSSSSVAAAAATTRMKRRSQIRPIASLPLRDMRGDPDGDNAIAGINYLKNFGYFQKDDPLRFHLPMPSGSDSTDAEDPLTEAISKFQSYFGLRQTKRLDRATLALMKKPRCGVADIPEEEDDSSRESRNSQSPSNYNLLGTKWHKNILSWRLEQPTSQVSRDEQLRTMQRAFDTWRRVTPLEFRQTQGRDVDINIKFGGGAHGDDYPFDGPGKVLAHAFGPGEGPLDGDMHFDDHETWTNQDDGNGKPSDLELVAAHELGHSLGLSHSRDPNALMYPYYGLTDRLGRDDILAIQSLYGIRIGQPRTTARPPRRTTTTRRPITRTPYTTRPTYTDRPQPRTTTTTTTTTTPVVECGVQFDIVIQDDVNNRNVFSGLVGDRIYRFDSYGILPGFPTYLSTVYPNAPSHADAVFTIPERAATYFIKDNRVWRYHRSQLDPEYPKDLVATHFPEVIRFVLPIVDTTGHRRIFVFGTTLWWEYNFDDLPSALYRPRYILIPQYWPAIASDVNYAVMGADNYIYLISPNSHVILDSFRRAMFGGKQEGHPQFLQPACQMRSVGSGSASLPQNNTISVCVGVFMAILAFLQRKS